MDSRAVTHARSGAGPEQCLYGSICAWDEGNYEGSFRAWEGSNPNWHDSDFGDRARSLKNNLRPGGPDAVRLYADPNYGGNSFCLPRGDFAEQLSSWGNDISSHRLVEGC
ncbi:peptidase inhibitor family I36 protein [Streptomyces sp. NPDC041068]|uniref:peptidase inhibitor family I36 protein n=1 Tax=Streptomyces sp. NPDC041068 TaxID=3155130 RepID=UPI00340A6C2E